MYRFIATHDKKKCGFTLIEIMLALLVITIGVVAMTGLLGKSLDTSAKSHTDIDVVSFADLVFNYSHSLTNFSAIPTAGTFTIPGYNEDLVDIQVGTLSQFTCQVTGYGSTPHEAYTVSYRLDIAAAGNIKELTLQVWPGFNTNGQPRRFYTEIYNWAKN
jgi:prepilin-type N-terminal cleavage/methylation domain-containing protein